MHKNSHIETFISNNVPIARIDSTIGEIEEYLTGSIDKFISTDYVYILDNKDSLKFYLPIKVLFRKNKNAKASSLIEEGFNISVNKLTKPHQAALKAMQESLTSIAVTDETSKFLGAVTTQDILKIIDTRTIEHILRVGGLAPRHKYHTDESLKSSLRHRIPWLVIGMLGGLVVAYIISLFEKTMGRNILIAAFVPLIIYMADAVTSQLEAFMIRDLDRISKFNLKNYLKKQIKIVFYMALLISIFLFIISSILFREFTVVVAISVALFMTIISAIFSGVGIPFILKRIKQDPAYSAGPLSTIIQELISIIIYFFVVSLLL